MAKKFQVVCRSMIFGRDLISEIADRPSAEIILAECRTAAPLDDFELIETGEDDPPPENPKIIDAS